MNRESQQSASRTSFLLRPLLWSVWLLVIASPLLFVRVNFDPDARTWRATFRHDRWHNLWHDAPAWAWHHAGDLILLALIIGAIAGFTALWNLPSWGRFRNGLEKSTRGRWRNSAVGLIAILTLIICCRHLDNTQLEWGVMGCTYIVLAMGLNLTVGMTGLLVLGYAGFVAVGGYTFAVMNDRWGVSIWTAFIPAAVIGGALGGMLALPSIRLRGDYLAIVTLGFGETVRFLIKNLVGEQSLVIAREARVPALLSEHSLWRTIFPEGLTRLKTELWVAAAMVALSMWLVRNLANSRLGRAWIAIREDETAAAAMGIPTVRMKLLAFTLSAVWASVAGVFFVAHNTSANPEMFGFSESVLILSMVVLGGMGSGPGPIVGAIVLYLIPEILRSRFPALVDYRPMIVGVLMAAMMIFRPQGLMGSLRRKIEIEPESESS